MMNTMEKAGRTDRNTGLDQYLKDIQRYPLLSREEEIELARRVKNGDRAAMNQLVSSNLRFVVSIAKRYAGNGVPLEDLVNDGNVGLVKAAERFDPDRGFKFISYAVWWIRQSILLSISENSRMIRLPMNRVGLSQKAVRVARQIEQNEGREAEIEEIARELSVPAEDIEEVFNMSRAHLSIDAPVNDDGDEATFVDQIVDETSPAPDEGVYAATLGRDLWRALGTLPERERSILVTYYGLGGKTPKTLEEIGAEQGYTRERIRQLKEQALEKLRTKPQVKYVADYLTA